MVSDESSVISRVIFVSFGTSQGKGGSKGFSGYSSFC